MIFHNLGGYDSHLIFDKIKNIDVKMDVLEKYMASILNKKIFFVDSM